MAWGSFLTGNEFIWILVNWKRSRSRRQSAAFTKIHVNLRWTLDFQGGFTNFSPESKLNSTEFTWIQLKFFPHFSSKNSGEFRWKLAQFNWIYLNSPKSRPSGMTLRAFHGNEYFKISVINRIWNRFWFFRFFFENEIFQLIGILDLIIWSWIWILDLLEKQRNMRMWDVGCTSSEVPWRILK